MHLSIIVQSSQAQVRVSVVYAAGVEPSLPWSKAKPLSLSIASGVNSETQNRAVTGLGVLDDVYLSGWRAYRDTVGDPVGMEVLTANKHRIKARQGMVEGMKPELVA
jgi:hypothetical protein